MYEAMIQQLTGKVLNIINSFFYVISQKWPNKTFYFITDETFVESSTLFVKLSITSIMVATK